MTVSLVLAFAWALAANVAAMIPSRDSHWSRARVLIALGLPILGFVVWQNGVPVGLLVLAAGMSVLRWPVRFLLRWLRARVAGGVR